MFATMPFKLYSMTAFTHENRFIYLFGSETDT